MLRAIHDCPVPVIAAVNGAAAGAGASRCGRCFWRVAVMLQLVRDGELVPHGVKLGLGTLESRACRGYADPCTPDPVLTT